MIQKTELRIGNKVFDPTFSTLISEVEQMHSEYVVTNYNDSISLSKLDPIPLTPEILEKCGFVKHIIDRYESWHLDISPVDKFMFYKGLMQFGVLGVGNYEWSNAKIKYLHQLQNLYFSLTSTELTINI